MINFWHEVEPDLDLHVGGRNDEADGGVRRVSVLEKKQKNDENQNNSGTSDEWKFRSFQKNQKSK